MENDQTQTLRSGLATAQSWLRQAASRARGPIRPAPADQAGPHLDPAPTTNVFAYRKPLRAYNFVCAATEAKAVSLVGDFNQWNSAAHPMKQMPDRTWFLSVELKHGHHRYAFLVDGRLMLDPQAQGKTRNDEGEVVSLVPVS